MRRTTNKEFVRMIIYLGHKLISAPMINYPDDMVCLLCKVRLEPKLDKRSYRLVFNYSFNIGGTICNYDLTCEKQQIKNLLE